MTNKQSLFQPIIICLLGAMFYLYEFALQVCPGVITNELMRDLHLNAAGLGAMAAFYYYAYTPMQLPAGMLYDRFGPRRLITIAILICAAGALFFSMTQGMALASLGRFLMGIGSAFSFIGALLLVSRWFPPQYFAFIAGLVYLMSSIGAISGQVPLVAAVAIWGWRHTIAWIAFAGIFLALLVYLVVRDAPSETIHDQPLSQPGELKRLRDVCSNGQNWLIALYSFSIWAPIVVFALWGIPFLVKAYEMSTHTASLVSSMMWIGIGVGGPIIGWWSDHMERRCLPLTFSGILGAISVAAVIFVPGWSVYALFALMFAFGVASSANGLAFAVVKDNNHSFHVGTAIGFNNMATVAGGALFQPLVGIFLNMHSSGIVNAGVPLYSLADYRFALALVPLCFLLSVIVSARFLRETHCKSIDEK